MYARAFKGALAALITTSVLLAGCGGGDEGGGGIKFTITAVNPDTSVDLTGGDRVTVSGTNFFAAGVAVVRFGATNGINLQVMSDTSLEVTTPPAPGGTAQTVTLEVVSLNASPPSVLFFNAYTYVGVSGPPRPNTISRTQFSATGMESFFIDGSSLGPPNGMVEVEFVGIGKVPAQVNATSTFVSGIAPVSPSAPPLGPITVRVINGTESGDVPTQVQYSWNVPASINLPG
ncbi:MAG: IPT/TIG domain-containing protein, partial [Planctomycetota bacterium]